jgi:hypothetical protein
MERASEVTASIDRPKPNAAQTSLAATIPY